MSETWFTADCHFGHENIIRLCKRPFACLEEMEETLIDNWNSRVGKTDTVWVVGDFAYRGRNDDINRCYSRLNGQKCLIIGNHDEDQGGVLKLRWHAPPVLRKNTRVNGQAIVLDHYPQREWQGLYSGAVHFFGHVHASLPPLGRSIDVGVDAHGFAPVHADEAIKMAIHQDPQCSYDPKKIIWQANPVGF